jgi:predicted DCC family thiol-disulfide oxidoreductase YuxK
VATLLPDGEWTINPTAESQDSKEAARPLAARAGARAQVLYDGQCAFCVKSIDLLRRLDWLRRLTYSDARQTQNLPVREPPLDPGRFLEEMHLLLPGGDRLLHGFRAFRWIAWRLPLLWPIAPLLYLPGMSVIGQRAYLWVARHRFQLIPCHGGVCEMQVKSKK